MSLLNMGDQTIDVSDMINGDTTFNYDSVNKPAHYNLTDGIECIDYIKQVLGLHGFVAYCRGNVIKYNHNYVLSQLPYQFHPMYSYPLIK